MPKWEVTYRGNRQGSDEVEAADFEDRPPFLDFVTAGSPRMVVLRVRAEDVQSVALKT